MLGGTLEVRSGPGEAQDRGHRTAGEALRVDARIRILVADDHPMLREGLVAVLGTQPDFEVVGEAADGSEAVRLAETPAGRDPARPRDARGRRRRRPGRAAGCRVHIARDSLHRLRHRPTHPGRCAGARGYLLKGASRTEIFDAIRTVHAGGSLLEPGVTTRLLDQLRENRELREPLTKAQVLVLISEGLHNSEIAERLFVTERTVKFHVSSILAKLGADNRTEAVAVAARRGLIQMPG